MKGLLYFIIVLFSVSCTRTVYVPVESVNTQYRDRFLRDSVYVRDSVLSFVRGDTVWMEKYRYGWKERLVRDSVFINDTVRVAYPVEKVLSRWERMKMDAGGMAIGGCLFLMVIVTGYVIYRVK